MLEIGLVWRQNSLIENQQIDQSSVQIVFKLNLKIYFCFMFQRFKDYFQTMGILGLSKLIADVAPTAIKENEIKNYFGRKVAIDASMSLYQFLIAVR